MRCLRAYHPRYHRDCRDERIQVDRSKHRSMEYRGPHDHRSGSKALSFNQQGQRTTKSALRNLEGLHAAPAASDGDISI